MRGKYNTDQKILIKQYLEKNSDKFINAEDIMEYMKKNNQGVGLTTIYRFLNYLEKNENVRTEIKNHTKYYQYISDECSNHFHLKCKKCGKEIHLDCNDFKKVNEHIYKEHKFKLDHNTIIYGECDKCRS